MWNDKASNIKIHMSQFRILNPDQTPKVQYIFQILLKRRESPIYQDYSKEKQPGFSVSIDIKEVLYGILLRKKILFFIIIIYNEKRDAFYFLLHYLKRDCLLAFSQCHSCAYNVEISLHGIQNWFFKCNIQIITNI